MPGVFGIRQNDSNELRCIIARRLIVDLPRLRQLRFLLGVKQRHWIAPEQEIKNYDNDAANSAAHGNASAAGSANIFNVLAFSSSLPEHLFVSLRGIHSRLRLKLGLGRESALRTLKH